VVPLAVAGVGLSVGAAFTTPFTAPADTVSALGIAAMAVAVTLTWRRPAPAPAPAAVPRSREHWWPWALLLCAGVALELVSYLSGPRVDHPTVSSLYDSATTLRPIKGLFFAAWLALGAALVRR